MDFLKYIKKLGKVIFFLCAILSLVACSSPEEIEQQHLQKGKEFFEKGEFDKALLEFKNANKSGKKIDAIYYLALLDEKHNNYQPMYLRLREALVLDPSYIPARLKLGSLYILAGQFDNALEQAQAILLTNHDNVDAQILKASVYLRQDKFSDVEPIINFVLTNNPDNIEALSLKANYYYRRNEIEKALAVVDTVLAKDSANIPIRLFRIRVNAGLKNTNAMEADYKELIRLEPSAENFKLNLASMYSTLNRLQDAEALLQEMVNKSPDKVEPKIILLEFFNAKARERVTPAYEAWLAENKLTNSQLLELSKWMMSKNFPDAALNGLQQVVNVEKNNNTGLTAQTLIAEIAFNKKQYDAVETAINSILQQNIDFTEASMLKARLLISQNKIDGALEVLKRLVLVKTKSSDILALLGQTYLLKNDPEQANANFKQALELDPANLMAFFPIYNQYLQSQQEDLAKQILDKGLKAKPYLEQLLTIKAESAIADKNWDEAQEAIQQLSMFARDKSVPVYLSAKILQGKGQYTDAIALYQKLLEDFPEHFDALINLVKSFEAINAKDQAITFMEAQIAKHPDSQNVSAVLSDLYIANGSFDKAKKFLTEQLARMPHATALYFALVRVENGLKKNPDIEKQIYLKGLASNPNDLPLMLALAEAYEKVGDLASVRSSYEHILQVYPNSKLVINNLAGILLESGKADDVKIGAELAEKLKDSDVPSFQDTYAWALIKSGNVANGIRILDGLISKDANQIDLRYHRGMANYLGGSKAQAAADLKSALSLAEKQGQAFSRKSEAQKVLQELEPNWKK